ncbi:MAG: di-trans,poly-cis-decaprenylcistransferase [Alphaproteobacteria bacterium]|nr:di-trans,poly-cis-decaprenylcistransferase [Alphaproteobacteria bacterium]
MDGNGRWASAQGLPKVAGHRAGALAAKNLIPRAKELGIKTLTLFTFSKENWGRNPQEVRDILSLILDEIQSSESELQRQEVRLKIIGALDDFPSDIAEQVRLLEAKSAHYNGLTMIFALSYGARQDITQAVSAIGHKIANGQIDPDDLDEALIAEHLWTAGLPTPELFIRTSGELRLSNFLLWEIAYTELYFTTCLWPDFTPDHLNAALDSFANRKRYFGKSRHV